MFWSNLEWWIVGQHVTPISPCPVCDAGRREFPLVLAFFHSALLHDILYSILQKQNPVPLKTRQVLEIFSCSNAELKENLTADDAQVHPGAKTPRKRRRSDSVSVAAQWCEIMMEWSKARYGMARHLQSFELTDPELFPLFETDWTLQVNISQWPAKRNWKVNCLWCTLMTSLQG